MEGELERSGGESWVVGDPPAQGEVMGCLEFWGVSGTVWWWAKAQYQLWGKELESESFTSTRGQRWEVLVDRFLWYPPRVQLRLGSS